MTVMIPTHTHTHTQTRTLPHRHHHHRHQRCWEATPPLCACCLHTLAGDDTMSSDDFSSRRVEATSTTDLVVRTPDGYEERTSCVLSDPEQRMLVCTTAARLSGCSDPRLISPYGERLLPSNLSAWVELRCGGVISVCPPQYGGAGSNPPSPSVAANGKRTCGGTHDLSSSPSRTEDGKRHRSEAGDVPPPQTSRAPLADPESPSCTYSAASTADPPPATGSSSSSDVSLVPETSSSEAATAAQPSAVAANGDERMLTKPPLGQLLERVYLVEGYGDHLLFGIPILVRPDGSIVVHPRLAPALRTACEQNGLADCVAALCESVEAPIPAALAMYGCEGKDGLTWSPSQRGAVFPTRKAPNLEFHVHLCLNDLIERLESSVPVLPPNMNPEEKEALQSFDAATAMLVGLKEIKEKLRKFVLSVIYDRRQHSSTAQRIMHVAITGPSGVGKSTLACVIRDALHTLRLVNDNFVKVGDGSDLKGCVRQKMQEATGGVLFVDEAYQLSGCKIANGQLTGAIDPQGFEGGSKASGGKKASGGTKKASDGPINALVIVAGYHKEMMDWLSPGNATGNKGLDGRISETFEMPGYSEEELMQIADLMLQRPAHQATLATPQARTQLQACVNDISKMLNSQNARAVEQVLNYVKREHGVRMVLGGHKGVSGNVYTEADVDAGVKAWRENNASRSRGTKRASESCASQGGSRRVSGASGSGGAGASSSGDVVSGAGSRSDAHHVRLSPRASQTRARSRSVCRTCVPRFLLPLSARLAPRCLMCACIDRPSHPRTRP